MSGSKVGDGVESAFDFFWVFGFFGFSGSLTWRSYGQTRGRWGERQWEGKFSGVG